MFNKEVRKQRKEEKLAKKQAAYQKAQLKKLSCPRCHSEDFTILGNHKKSFSVGKAVGGAILAGGIGSLVGFIGKNSKKLDIVCNKCGKRYKKKPI